MTAPVPPPKQPSLLWPIVAVLAWGLLLADVYLRLPFARNVLEAMQVPVPPVSRWVLDNAAWVVPALGLATFLLAGWIRNHTARWVLTAVVAILLFLVLLAIRLHSVFLVRPALME